MRQTIQVIAPSRSTRPTGGARTLAGRVVEAVGRIAAEVNESLSRPAMNRRVLHRLSVLTERELKDIGLTRADVIQAAIPDNGDATGFLIGRRDERLGARRSH